MTYIPSAIIIFLVIATYIANDDDRIQKNRFYLLVTAAILAVALPYIGNTTYFLALLCAIRSIPLRYNPGERSFIMGVVLIVAAKVISALI